MQPTVIVLASGRGERFLASGGQTHKLQALLLDTTVLEHTLAAVRASGLPFHVEAAGHPGMGDSIAAAVRATAGADGWLILPADLPLVQARTLLRMAQADDAHRVVVPSFEGQGGHPVRFAASCGPALMNLKGNQGAALIVKELGAIKIETDDFGCVTDIDTVQDLERARQLLLRRRKLGHST
jgi:molybdenum cofactor cytidylyltransferase